MGTNCAPLPANLFLKASFKGFARVKINKILPQTVYSSFRYIDDVLSLNNSQFSDYLHFIHPNELEVKDTTDTQKSASYHDLNIEINNGGRLKTKLYNKRDDFTLRIVNFLLISSTIPASPAYGVNISKFISLSKPFHQYSDFQNRAQLLTQNLLKQGYAMLGWSNHYKNSTTWLTVTKYPYLDLFLNIY